MLGVEIWGKGFLEKEIGKCQEKLNARWEKGIFVVVNRASQEAILVNEEGMVQARDVLRMPFGQRWGDDCIRWLKWVPWHRYKRDDRADGDLERRKRRSKRGKRRKWCL